jgi:hypothetical protein
VGHAEDESGGEKEPRGEGAGRLRKKKGEKGDEDREKPGSGLPEENGHRR